jgi:hypothetical protein
MSSCLIVYRWRTYFFRPPLPLSPALPLFGAGSAAANLEVPALAGAAKVAATTVSATAAAAAAASFSAHQKHGQVLCKKNHVMKLQRHAIGTFSTLPMFLKLPHVLVELLDMSVNLYHVSKSAPIKIPHIHNSGTLSDVTRHAYAVQPSKT